MNCDICNKHFTGTVCYNLHLESEKHKKKAWNITSNNTCSSPSLDNSISSSNSCDKNSNKSVSFKDEYENYIGEITVKELDKLSSLFCKTCQKQCNSLVQFDQHIEGEQHKRNVQSSVQNNTAENLRDLTYDCFGPWFCKICLTNCNGPITLQQHLESEVHMKKKKIKATMLDVSSADNEGDNKNVNEANRWHCEIRDKTCSGQILYQQHLAGDFHKKNIHEKEVIDLSDSSLQDTTVINSTTDVDNFKANSEHVDFPEIIEPLTIKDVKMTVFLSDEEINFDKSAVKKNKMTVDTKHTENRIEIEKQFTSVQNQEILEVKDKSQNIFDKCDLCSVLLTSKTDFLDHYNSFEHTKRKLVFLLKEGDNKM